MAAISTRSLAQLVQRQAAAMQAKCSQLLDFSVGSILRAVVDSNAAISLWLQAEVIKVLRANRLSTSTGSDVDSFVQDFGMTRLGAQKALGTVTFSRFTPSAQAVIPIGAVVRTADTLQTFRVVIDSSNTAYNAGLSGYVIPSGVASMSVPVEATAPGAGGNVLANTVTTIVGSITYVDTVNNVAPFSGGGEQEGDESVKTRFTAYINSLSKATAAAIEFEAKRQRIGIEFTITENYDPNGSFHPGSFLVCIDDGSGTPPSALVTDVYAAVDTVRAGGIMMAVVSPSILTATVAMTLTIAPGYDVVDVRGRVGTSLMTNIKALGLGNSLPYTKLAQWAYEASPGVRNVTAITLNGLTADLVASKVQTVKPGTITVS